MSAHDRNTAVPPVSILIMAGMHNPYSMVVPSTGMDVQYGPSDLAAQMGTCNMQQQVQDVYWIQPPQFSPLDQQMLFPSRQFVQQPTATAGAPSQQARDAVTMSSAMWKMMNTVLQQQQHMVYPGYRPGTPRTPLHQNAGTPIGTPRCPGGMATHRFSAPTPFHTMPPGMPW